MSSPRERERGKSGTRRERDKIHKKARRDAAANPKTFAARPRDLAKCSKGYQGNCSGYWGGPITTPPPPPEPSWSTHCTLLAWLWLWGVQRSNIKSYECLVSFVPKCGLQVFPTSFSAVFYLPAFHLPAHLLQLPLCPALPALPLPFATCENLCGKFFARTLCSKQKLVLRVGFTQAPQAHQARAVQCRHRRPAPSAAAAAARSAPALPQTMPSV